MRILFNIKRNLDVEENDHVLGKRDDKMGMDLYESTCNYSHCNVQTLVVYCIVSRLLMAYTPVNICI